MNRPQYISKPDWEILVSKYSVNKIKKYLAKDYPYQYLIGNVDFYNSNFIINKNVLIPRWETEELVNRIVNKLDKYGFKPNSGLDLCTGSGCIAISLSKQLNISFDAIDISKKSLKVALKNIKKNKANVKLKKADILKKAIDGKYDLIICNPPYVSLHEPTEKKIKYEPKKAIYAKHDGLVFYEVLLKKLVNNVNEKYLIAMEFGAAQKADILEIAKKYFSMKYISTEKDFNNKDRYLFISNIE